MKAIQQSKLAFKLTALVLVLGLNFLAVSQIGHTRAYYGDTETSSGNLFNAALLDLLLSETSFDTLIGTEALGEQSLAVVAMPVEGSLDMQYALNASSTPTSLCSGLFVEAKLNGTTQYSGSLMGLAHPTSTDFGTWEFRFDLPPLASVAHGETCNMEALFHAWRSDISDPSESGYDDEELLPLSFTARMVVLNEILPSPQTSVTAPADREYVELYNNGNTSVDVLGWKVSEISGSSEKKYDVVASGATSAEIQPYGGASTIMTPGSELVLEFGTSGTRLNNDGDTVKLYDNGDVLLDSHTYPATAVGKAHARIPNGIGIWVDPEPTPGAENVVSIQELEASGLSDEEIELVMELIALVGAPEPVDQPLSPAFMLLDEEIVSTSTEKIISTTSISTEPLLEETTSTSSSSSTSPLILEEATSTEEVIIEEATSTESIIESTEKAEVEEEGIEQPTTNNPQPTTNGQEPIVEEILPEEEIISREEDILPPAPAPKEAAPQETPSTEPEDIED